MKVRSLRGISPSENQGNALRQDSAISIECKNRVLIIHNTSLDARVFFEFSRSFWAVHQDPLQFPEGIHALSVDFPRFFFSRESMLGNPCNFLWIFPGFCRESVHFLWIFPGFSRESVQLSVDFPRFFQGIRAVFPIFAGFSRGFMHCLWIQAFLGIHALSG